MASTKVYEMVTERIVKELEQGIIPWQKPWSGCKGGAFNYKSGRVYCLMNQFILLHRDGYLTFNQCKAMGGKVKKGAKAEVVFEWVVKNYQRKDEQGQPMVDEDGKPVMFKKISLTYDKVFWIGDCENLPEKNWEEQTNENSPVQEAELVITNYLTKSRVKFESRKSNEAFYSPFFDMVVVPGLDQYKNVEDTTAQRSTSSHTAPGTRVDSTDSRMRRARRSGPKSTRKRNWSRNLGRRRW